MKPASTKQKKLLRDFANDKKLQPILNGKDFDKLNSKEASDLIKECMKRNGQKDRSKQSAPSKGNKSSYNNLDTVELTEKEETQVREEHREHCKNIMQECLDDWPQNKQVAIAVFEKRADKIFTRLQRAKTEKQMQSKD
jgi:hypothetical protein